MTELEPKKSVRNGLIFGPVKTTLPVLANSKRGLKLVPPHGPKIGPSGNTIWWGGSVFSMAEFDHCTFTTGTASSHYQYGRNCVSSSCHWFAGDSGQSVSTQASSHRASIFGRSQKLYFLSGVHYARCGSPGPTSSSPLRQWASVHLGIVAVCVITIGP